LGKEYRSSYTVMLIATFIGQKQCSNPFLYAKIITKILLHNFSKKGLAESDWYTIPSCNYTLINFRISILKSTWCNFHSIEWESKASKCFENYLLILRRRCTNGIWYIACVNGQLAVARLQRNCNRATTNWHYTHAIY
jgi:hypothetical protein